MGNGGEGESRNRLRIRHQVKRFFFAENAFFLIDKTAFVLYATKCIDRFVISQT
jgi:hypothetical protein